MSNVPESMETSEVNPINEDMRKLFVGGLPQDATEKEILDHFTNFGEVESVNLKTDPNTGRSRGFCFIVFKDVESVGKSTSASDEELTLKNKKVAVKKAQAKQGKIYVGKLKTEVTDEDVKEHFAQYGTIANIEQPFDKMKNERKNFCFITFDSEEPAKRLLKEGSVTIKGCELDIKKVNPKGDSGRGGFGAWGAGYGQWGAGGGYGDYYGGYGADPYYGGWGGYGGGWGGFGPQGGAFGGKAPFGARGRGAPRGRGMARGQRQKPY